MICIDPTPAPGLELTTMFRHNRAPIHLGHSDGYPNITLFVWLQVNESQADQLNQYLGSFTDYVPNVPYYSKLMVVWFSSASLANLIITRCDIDLILMYEVYQHEVERQSLTCEGNSVPMRVIS